MSMRLCYLVDYGEFYLLYAEMDAALPININTVITTQELKPTAHVISGLHKV